MAARQKLTPRFTTSLPAPPAGWFDVACAISLDGALIILRATSDIRAIWSDRLRLTQALAKTQGCLSVFDGSSETSHTVFALECRFPCFDRFHDGRWIVADSRCSTAEENARILSPDGVVTRRIALGDGINHLQCDRSGTVWVGYFDEGIFSDDIGAAGLARLDATGTLIWSYNTQYGIGRLMSDCYSLNVTDDIWSCFYVDFPLLRVDRLGQGRLWQNGTTDGNRIIGVSALAVDEGHILLAGGYERDRDRLALAGLGQKAIVPLAVFDLDVSQRGSIGMSLLQGRGDQLHVVRGGYWHQVTVADVVAATS